MSFSPNNSFLLNGEPWEDDLENVFEKPQEATDTPTVKTKRRVRNNQPSEMTSQVLSAPAHNVNPTDITDAVRHSFISYAMSVIIARALPDARDGLKPVHRRILYAMFLLGLEWNRAHKKSARIVGETLGRFHPHGDGPTYGAMTRMVQPFLMRYPLVDGHGNFGSIDGDPPAAMRYTEARMTKLSSKMVLGITKDAVPMALNYDASEKEPTVLPARFPNLLVSGSTGIAVGMATNIPPHNINEVINGVVAYAENPAITNEELMAYIPGPDFPTGALILGTKGIKSAYTTGNGSLTIRSKTHFEQTSNNRTRIIVTEVPYMINKANMVKKIASLAKDKVVEGISGLRDESNQKGIRVVIEVKRGHVPEIVLNKLFKYSPLQSHFGVNLLALDKGEPKVLTLKDAIRAYFDHQKQVVTRVTKFDLKKTQHRLHILEGLRVAVQNIDAVIKVIRNASNVGAAQANLRDTYRLSKVQSEAITSMQLGRLTNLAIKTMNEEIVNLEKTVRKLNEILTDPQVLTKVITTDLIAIKEVFADRRRTQIVVGSAGNISEEDLIPKRDIAITLSRKGFVKRIDLAQYRAQRRGGIGATSAKTYEDDDVLSIVTTTTHTDILVFTASARVYRLRAYQIPEMSKQAKGQHFVNLVNIKKGDNVISLLPVDNYDDTLYLVTVTKKGIVKKTLLSNYRLIFTNGKYALKLKADDTLFATMIVQANDELLIGSAQGKVVRFNLNEVRPTARVTAGVKGIRLGNSRDKVVGASIFRHEGNVLSIGTRGFGKMTPVVDYRLTKRGAKGVQTINTRKSGNLVVMSVVHGNEDIIVLTSKGLTIRTNLSQVNTISRTTKGVTIVRLAEGIKIQSLAVVDTQSVENVAQEALAKTQELDITDIRDDALDVEDLTDVDEEE